MQLVRILVKLMPDSAAFLAVTDEGGGGNRVKEEHIKEYLAKVLGGRNEVDPPPYPDWGVGNGWAAYLARKSLLLGHGAARLGLSGCTYVCPTLFVWWCAQVAGIGAANRTLY